MEKIFNPAIRNRVVVVLTNNDGVICSVCPIGRDLGIPKFEPYFKVKHLLDKHNAVVFSSNYELYQFLSDSMMNILARFAQNTYVYSIDEAFSEFDNYSKVISNYYDYGHKMRRAVWREIRLPIGVGISSTLTLAKAANHASKKLPGADGVALIDNEESRKHILSQMKLSDVWGIGRRLNVHLSQMGIKNAWELSTQSPKKMRKFLSVNVERTVNELNGVPCLSWDDVRAEKKEIYSTRSLGQRITNQYALLNAFANHVDIVCNKSFNQKTLIKSLVVFASNSPFDDQYYKKSIKIEFNSPTLNRSKILNGISDNIAQLFDTSIAYYRVGVGAVDLKSTKFIQYDFFSDMEDSTLTNCYQNINQRFGKGMIRMGTQIGHEHHKMKRLMLSPRYNTRWSDIPVIKC